MPSNCSLSFTTEPENNLREKLIRSIWLHKDKYCYLFEPDGSYRLLSTDRRGQYTLSADGRSVLLAWTTDPFTESLFVQEDGSLFMSGGAFVEIGIRSEASLSANSSIEANTAIPNPSQSEEAEDEHSTLVGYEPYYSTPPVYLELSDDHSHKFYEVTVNGFDVIIRYGRIGTVGQTNRSTYVSLQKAEAEAQKKINQKRKKGYVRVRPSSSSVPTAITKERSRKVQNTRPHSDLDITQFVRPAWKPIVTQGDGCVIASKFCGRSWLAADEPWPTCPCCSKPMQLFLQLNLGELPEPVREEFGTGLLQMFHCIRCNAEADYELGTIYYGRVPFLIRKVRIRLVQPFGNGSTPPLPEINGKAYGTDFPALTITDWREIQDYPDLDDLVALVYGFEQVQEDHFWDEVVRRLGLDDLDEYDEVYPTDQGDKLGGYPRWVQGMECPGCPVCYAPMRQVFQLASYENLSYMFGDMGIAHVLQCRTHKEEFAFVWAGS